MVDYRRMAPADVGDFIETRIRQLREEGATEDVDLRPALRDYYRRHMADGSFVAWLAVDGGRIVARGTPEDIRSCPESVTGKFL